MRTLKAYSETWPIRGSFTISRGSKSEAVIVVCQISQSGKSGFGECVPYARFGETINSTLAEIERMRDPIERGLSHSQVLLAMNPGAARNAIDCALWDLSAKLEGMSVSSRICADPPRPISTAMTISLSDPDEMAAQARMHGQRALLKVKLGGDRDAQRIRSVAAAAPAADIILDANESWQEANLRELLLEAARAGVRLVEQPLPAGQDGILEHIPHPVPICADESAHVTGDLGELRERYDCVNIKLDKAGGLTEAIRMRDEAHRLGFSVMVGCMVGTSLSMAPAVLLAQNVEFVDLDGPLILATDRKHGLSYSSSVVSPPSNALWG